MCPPEAFERACSHFPSGLAVVSGHDGQHGQFAFTLSKFLPVSSDPLGRALPAPACPSARCPDSRISILREDQMQLARQLDHSTESPVAGRRPASLPARTHHRSRRSFTFAGASPIRRHRGRAAPGRRGSEPSSVCASNTHSWPRRRTRSIRPRLGIRRSSKIRLDPLRPRRSHRLLCLRLRTGGALLHYRARYPAL